MTGLTLKRTGSFHLHLWEESWAVMLEIQLPYGHHAVRKSKLTTWSGFVERENEKEGKKQGRRVVSYTIGNQTKTHDIT